MIWLKSLIWKRKKLMMIEKKSILKWGKEIYSTRMSSQLKKMRDVSLASSKPWPTSSKSCKTKSKATNTKHLTYRNLSILIDQCFWEIQLECKHYFLKMLMHLIASLLLHPQKISQFGYLLFILEQPLAKLYHLFFLLRLSSFEIWIPSLIYHQRN